MSNKCDECPNYCNDDCGFGLATDNIATGATATCDCNSKNCGCGETSCSEAKHFDEGKEPLELLPKAALFEIAKVMSYGSKKYGKLNYQKGMDWSKLIGSALRHIYKFNDGEDVDSESNEQHIAHAACNLMFLLYYIDKKKGTDDRLK